MVVGTLGLVFLFALSPINADIPRQAFSRNFDSNINVAQVAKIDLKFNSFYFAGAGGRTIYLGNWTGPLHMVRLSLPSLDTQHFDLEINKVNIPEDYQKFRLKVDSPNFYLVHGVLPGIFKGPLSSGVAENLLPVDPPYFVEAIPLTQRRMALRSVYSENHSYELGELTLDSPYFEFKPHLLEKQIDGLICEDGTLLYDRFSNDVVYLYDYRNQYIVMDTSLNLLNRFNTIDSFTRAPIKVTHVKYKNYSTLASPPFRVNLESFVTGRKLFVRSGLMSKKEDESDFRNSTVLDVYDITKGEYMYSFYLKDVNGKKPSSYIIVGSYLAAIFERQLMLYELRLPL
jgi:hypothetical protein